MRCYCVTIIRFFYVSSFLFCQRFLSWYFYTTDEDASNGILKSNKAVRRNRMWLVLKNRHILIIKIHNCKHLTLIEVGIRKYIKTSWKGAKSLINDRPMVAIEILNWKTDQREKSGSDFVWRKINKSASKAGCCYQQCIQIFLRTLHSSCTSPRISYLVCNNASFHFRYIDRSI